MWQKKLISPNPKSNILFINVIQTFNCDVVDKFIYLSLHKIRLRPQNRRQIQLWYDPTNNMAKFN